jgi:hypothetical protein
MGGHPLRPRCSALIPRLRSGEFKHFFGAGEFEMAEHCPVCGANYALVGRVHNCRPVPKARVANEVANKPRQKRSTYQHRDAERRRAYQAELMRKRRAAERAE